MYCGNMLTAWLSTAAQGCDALLSIGWLLGTHIQGIEV